MKLDLSGLCKAKRMTLLQIGNNYLPAWMKPQ